MATAGPVMSTSVPVTSAGQLLLKDSEAAYDLRVSGSRDGDFTQADRSGMSGAWLDFRMFRQGGTGSGNLTIAANTCWYVPFYNPRPLTITALGTTITGGAVTYTFGVSAVNTSTLAPGALLASGSVQANAAGSWAAPCAVTMPQGWLFLSMGSAGNSTGTNVNYAAMRPFQPTTTWPPSVSTTQPGWPNAWMASSSAVPVNNPAAGAGSWQYAAWLPWIAYRVA